MSKAEEIFNKLPHLGRDGHYFHISKTAGNNKAETLIKADTIAKIVDELKLILE